MRKHFKYNLKALCGADSDSLVKYIFHTTCDKCLAIYKEDNKNKVRKKQIMPNSLPQETEDKIFETWLEGGNNTNEVLAEKFNIKPIKVMCILRNKLKERRLLKAKSKL